MNVHDALIKWIDRLARDDKTKYTYRRSVLLFIESNSLPFDFQTEDLKIEHYEDFLVFLRKKYANPNTQAIYSIGVSRFLSHLFLKKMSVVNPEEARAAKKELTIQSKVNMRQFSVEDIDKILSMSETILEQVFGDDNDKLRAYRDRAFLVTLADTGLRVHEACNLRRGDIDVSEGKAMIIGKGRKQAVIRFTSRSIKSIRDYLLIRARLDGESGKPLASLPVFSQHSKSSSGRVQPITTETGRRIISEWVDRVLGDEKKGTITPHSFRHYFVTMILRVTQNMKLAQGLARHASIKVTERYTHLNDNELDQGYYEVFESK